MRKLRALSRREREIMDIVFRARRATASEVRKRMADPPSYSAVRATLSILERKGFLRHDDDRGRYVYRPKVKREAAARSALEHLLTTFFEGSAAGAMLALLERPDLELSSEDRDRMARLIVRARKEGH